MNISAVVIAKNSEDIIEDCLDSLQFCSEVIVVDAASTDKTRDIARSKGASVTIYDSNDFSALRNFGIKKATQKWILYIDTDERVTKELEKSILTTTENDKQDFVAYRIQRKNFYLGNHEWPTIERLERLFKKENLEGWYGELHESPKVTGSVGELDGFLLHYTHRDLSSMLSKTIEWSEKEARFRLEDHHPPVTWWRFFRVFFTGFFNSFIVQKGYTVGIVGMVESIYQGFSMFVTYARLWEMQQKFKSKNAKFKNTN